MNDDYKEGWDYLIINSPIDSFVYDKMLDAIARNKGKSKNLVLTVVTYGGLPNEAYKMGRLLQSLYDDIVFYVPSSCKSAGTLLAASASKIYFSTFGELGPLDVQLRKKDELIGRRSGLNTVAALKGLEQHTFSLFSHFMLQILASSSGAITFKTAAQIAGDMAASIMSNVYTQVDIEALGQDSRDLSVATDYCKRLAKKWENIDEAGIASLVNDYPSHDFVIDFMEAQSIYKHVAVAPDNISRLFQRYSGKLMSPRETADAIVAFVSFSGDQENDNDSDVSQDEDERLQAGGESKANSPDPQSGEAEAD